MRFVVPMNLALDAATPADAAAQSKKIEKLLKDPAADIMLKSEGIRYRGIVVGSPVPVP